MIRLFLLCLFFTPSFSWATEDIGLPEINAIDSDVDINTEQLATELSNANELPFDSEQVDTSSAEKLVPLDANCIRRVSVGYGVHPDILFAILLVEGGTLGETNRGNSDGTKDLSLFQMNESNLQELQDSFGITRLDVLNNGCLGAAIAARHLLRSIQNAPPPRNKMEYLSLLARYHSKTPKYNAIYALKLEEKFLYLAKLDDEDSLNSNLIKISEYAD